MRTTRGLAFFLGGSISGLTRLPARWPLALCSRFTWAASRTFASDQGRNSGPPRTDAENAEVSSSCPTSRRT
jgi:hypothetical protein